MLKNIKNSVSKEEKELSWLTIKALQLIGIFLILFTFYFYCFFMNVVHEIYCNQFQILLP